MRDPSTRDRESSPHRERRLWAGFLLAPLAWGVALVATYALSAVRCSLAGTAALTLVAAAIAGWGTLLALGEHRRLTAEEERTGDGSAAAGDVLHADSTRGRRRLMARVGWIMSALSVAAVLAHGAAILIVGCR